MAKQRPKNLFEDNYGYYLKHRTAELIKRLASAEGKELRVKLTPAQYLDRHIQLEADAKLSPQEREEARQAAITRTRSRIASAGYTGDDAEQLFDSLKDDI